MHDRRYAAGEISTLYEAVETETVEGKRPDRANEP